MNIKAKLRSIVMKYRARQLTKFGYNVKIFKPYEFVGNVEVGNNIHISSGCHFISSNARIIIEDYVIFGPNVTIYSGDHAIDYIGKHIIEVSDEDKKNTLINMIKM